MKNVKTIGSLEIDDTWGKRLVMVWICCSCKEEVGKDKKLGGILPYGLILCDDCHNRWRQRDR